MSNFQCDTDFCGIHCYTEGNRFTWFAKNLIGEHMNEYTKMCRCDTKSGTCYREQWQTPELNSTFVVLSTPPTSLANTTVCQYPEKIQHLTSTQAPAFYKHCQAHSQAILVHLYTDTHAWQSFRRTRAFPTACLHIQIILLVSVTKSHNLLIKQPTS